MFRRSGCRFAGLAIRPPRATKVEFRSLDQNQGGEGGAAANSPSERGAFAAADGEKMRGKKVALAFVVLMLIAGQAINYFVPEVDTAALDDQDQAQTQLTTTPATNVK